jgi:hypothetical protein
MLTKIEYQKGVLIVQSEAPEIVYVIDPKNDVLWVINKDTGAQLEIAAENVYKFADEMMSVADIYLKRRLSAAI